MAHSNFSGYAFLLAFLLTIPLANYFIANVGTVCPPDSPCLIPVAPGLLAPSGVIWAGLALVLRDLVQRRLGLGWSVAAVLAGAALSYAISPALATASAVAFLISELVDLAVYTPLQRRDLVLAVAASTVVGLVADTIAFLSIAFGSLEHFEGQIVGKLWMVILALPILFWIRNRDTRLGQTSDPQSLGASA